MTPGFSNTLSNTYTTTWNETASDLGVGIRLDDTDGNPGRQGQVNDVTRLRVGAEHRTHYGLKDADDTYTASTPRLIEDIVRVNVALELKRRAAVESSLALAKPYTTKPEIDHLTPAEREVIRRLSAAVPVLQELDILFKDDRGLGFLRELESHGDEASLRWFRKVAHDVPDPSPLAKKKGHSVLPSFPDPRPTYETVMPSALIPPGLDDEAFKAMVQAVSATHPEAMYNRYLSPLTTIVRDDTEPCGWRYVKVNRDPRFAARLARLAGIINHAAATPDLDESLKFQLTQVAEGLTNDDIFSHYADDRAWVVQSSGNLEITIGLGYGYSPMGKVRGAGLMIGVEKRGEADWLQKYIVPHLTALEEKFADLIGRDVYQARTIPNTSVVRVVDVLIDTEAKFRATLAFVHPSSGPVAREGLVKRVILANHHKAKFDWILGPLAPIALKPELAQLVSAEHFVMFAAAHEMMHALGPRPDMTVEREGRAVRISDAIGDNLYDAVEESKANVGGMVALAYLRDHVPESGVTAQYVRQVQTTFVAGLLRQIRFGNRAHGGGARAEMAWLFLADAGAVHLDGENLDIGFASLEPALEGLWGHIGRMQALGSQAMAWDYLKEKPKTGLPDGLDQVIANINAAGIPVDVDMVYPNLDALFW